MAKTVSGTEIVPLTVDTSSLAEYDEIRGNLAEVQRMCDEIASEYHVAPAIDGADAYRSAKERRAYWRRALKQVEDERKRVKTAYLAPLTTFETGAKHATASLTEVIGRQDGIIKEYEEGCRERKRARLESYWEQTYPLYALCTGEAEEPLVPFGRVFDPDWVKRMGEIGDDKPATDAMDAIARDLARSEDVLERFAPEVRTAALSELYRTLDLSEAVHRGEQEERRRADIERQRAALRPEQAPAPEAPQAPSEAPVEAPVEAPAGQAPAAAPEAPREAEYMITIPCTGEDKDAIVAVLKAHGIRGSVKRIR
ncbi:MAG: DUF1351 domain-containing protein [Coriobacteriaceae bacterium]|nr:DUF1351 domain-containing protein [Coriobacteriaceae bacterium]